MVDNSPQSCHEKRLRPLSRAPIACARHVGAPYIVSDLQKLIIVKNRSIFEKVDIRAHDTDVFDNPRAGQPKSCISAQRDMIDLKGISYGI